MTADAHVEPRLGRVFVAYADPSAGSWALIALGAALFVGGAIISPLAVGSLVAPHPHDSTGDIVGGLVFGATLLFGGLALLVWSIRDRIRKPAFYVCEHGIAKVSNKGPVWTVFWREVDHVVVVRVLRAGQAIGFRVRLGKRLVFAPSEQVARQAEDLWAATNAHAAGVGRAAVT